MVTDRYRFWTEWSEEDGECVGLCDGEDIEDHRELAAARAERDYVSWDEVKVAPGFSGEGCHVDGGD